LISDPAARSSYLPSRGQDETTIINKVIASEFLFENFAAAGINFDASQSLSNTLAHNQIAAVTSDFTTVSAAESAITAFIAAHPNGTAVAADRFAS
jgi:hypothetical protein